MPHRFILAALRYSNARPIDISFLINYSVVSADFEPTLEAGLQPCIAGLKSRLQKAVIVSVNYTQTELMVCQALVSDTHPFGMLIDMDIEEVDLFDEIAEFLVAEVDWGKR